MALNTATKTYQGLTKTIDNNGRSITEVYKGSQEACEMFASSHKIGQTSSYGSLASINIQQEEGPIWSCELEWSIEYDANGNEIPKGSSYGPKQSSLTVRMLSLPIENRGNYCTNWNYHLIALGTNTVPSWWETAKTTVISNENDIKIYRWIKEASEIPLEKTDGKSWRMIKQKTKPRS